MNLIGLALGLILLAGCANAPGSSPSLSSSASVSPTSMTSSPGQISMAAPSNTTSCQKASLAVSVGAGGGSGAFGTTWDGEFGMKPKGLTSVLVEARFDSSPSDLVERLQVDLHDEANNMDSVNEPNERGTYQTMAEARQWSQGPVGVRVYATDGAVIAQKTVDVCATFFLNGPAVPGFTAFP